MIRRFVNGDIATSGQQFITGPDATAQGIYHRLRTFLGEYFLDISDGTPWFDSVLGKAPQDIAEINLKQRILTAPGVVALTDFQFESDRRSRNVRISATVIDVNNQAVQVLMNEDIV